MSTINTGNHPAALWPGVRKFVMGKYDEHPLECKQIFDMKKSKMAYEEDVGITSFGLAPVKDQGAAYTYDSHTQGGTRRYTHIAYGMGYSVTREEMDDNQYSDKSFNRGEMLAFSFRTTKEIVAANVLNRGFNASYTGIDGKEMLATDHATLAGSQSNELAVAADFSEAALEDLLIQIHQAKNDRGLEIAISPKKLIIPADLAFEAERILNSTLRSGTANNDMNAVNGKIPGGIVVNHYLTDADAWFVQTNAPSGLLGFMRTAFEFKKDNDQATDNALAKAYERYSFGWTDWRGIYGSPGAA